MCVSLYVTPHCCHLRLAPHPGLFMNIKVRGPDFFARALARMREEILVQLVKFPCTTLLSMPSVISCREGRLEPCVVYCLSNSEMQPMSVMTT